MGKELRDLVDLYEHIRKYGGISAAEYFRWYDISAYTPDEPFTFGFNRESLYTVSEVREQKAFNERFPKYIAEANRAQEKREREALSIATKDLVDLVLDLNDRLDEFYDSGAHEKLAALTIQVENLQASIATLQEDRETLITQLDALESSLNTRISELANETSNATATNLALHYSSLEKALGKINTKSLGYKIASLETSNAKIRAELAEVNARLASIRTDARILKHFERIDTFVGVAKWVAFWAVLFIAAIVPILGLKNLMA